MIKNVLVVCVGNVCRSPLGERILQANCPKLKVTSAGIGALVGKPANDTTALVAERNGVSLEGHVARQADADILSAADLILVMETGHKAVVTQIAPHVSGRVMLADHWTGGGDIADPYRRSEEFHQHVFEKIKEAMDAWASRLAK